MHRTRFVFVVSLLTSASARRLLACQHRGPWAGWQGPPYHRKSGDTGLLKEWPEGGPKSVWKFDMVGDGFGSMAVVGDRVYSAGWWAGSPPCLCLIWKAESMEIQARLARQEKPSRSRATPTLDGDRLYLLSGNGVVGGF